MQQVIAPFPIRLPQGYHTKAEIVYRALKDAIVTGHLPPGTRLRLRVICQQLSVSPTPVREALRALAQERLVDIHPHSDARVADLPVDELRENLLIRAELEALATRLAVPHLTADRLGALAHLYALIDECLADDGLRRYGETRTRSHPPLG